MPIGDAGVDRGRADALVPEVVLDELQSHTGIEQMGCNRMPEAVAGVPAVEAGQIAVAREKRLDLALPKWTRSATEERILCANVLSADVRTDELGARGKERLLGPGAALEALNHNPATLKVNIAPAEECHLSHSQAVVVDQPEKRPIAEGLNRPKVRADFDLREVARQAGGRGDEARRRRERLRK